MADENSVLRRNSGRKRKFPDQNESIRKQLYNTGAGYYRKDGVKVEPKVFQLIKKCCVRNCHSKLSELEQSQIFREFYALGSFELRSSFLSSCVSEVEPLRRTKKDEQSRRGFTKNYTLSNERVCKTFFCDLLQISSKRVEVALKKLRDEQVQTVRMITRKPTLHNKATKPVVQKQAMTPDNIDLLKIEQDPDGEVFVESYVIGQENVIGEENEQIIEYLDEESYTIEDEIEVVDNFEERPKQFDESFVCSCPNGCTEKLPLKTRRQLFQMFWNIGTSFDRSTFVNCCVSENQKLLTKNGLVSNRKFFVKGVEICEQTFTKTLMISSAQIDHSLQHEDTEEEVDPKEKMAAHIVENFAIQPLLDYMCSNFNEENPDIQVSVEEYRGELIQ